MKICIVGGGSYLWAFGLARQIINSKHLTDVQLVLMDIDPSALDLVAGAARLYNEAQGSPINIEMTNHHDAAFDGADFVVISISTGAFPAMAHDLEIPQKYGIFHTVGDTVGPGGWMRAVRNIPVFDDLAARMKRLCPNAWLLNVTNPLTPLTRVPHRNHGIKTIGMCPGVEESARDLANIAGAQPDARLDYTVTGIDHGSWFTSLNADGMDVLQRLKELGCCQSDDLYAHPEKRAGQAVFEQTRGYQAGFAVWRELGYLPSIMDRHTVENWPWFVPKGSPDLPYGLYRTTIADREACRLERERSLQRYLKTRNDQELGEFGHGDDPLIEVIESLMGYRSFLWGSNYRNIGQLPGFPEDAVVETRCYFDRGGVHPLISPMPDLLKAIVLPQVLRQEMIIDIALSGSFAELVALVATDPLCSQMRLTRVKEMVREMLTANQSLIRNPRLLECTGGAC